VLARASKVSLIAKSHTYWSARCNTRGKGEFGSKTTSYVHVLSHLSSPIKSTRSWVGQSFVIKLQRRRHTREILYQDDVIKEDNFIKNSQMTTKTVLILLEPFRFLYPVLSRSLPFVASHEIRQFRVSFPFFQRPMATRFVGNECTVGWRYRDLKSECMCSTRNGPRVSNLRGVAPFCSRYYFWINSRCNIRLTPAHIIVITPYMPVLVEIGTWCRSPVRNSLRFREIRNDLDTRLESSRCIQANYVFR